VETLVRPLWRAAGSGAKAPPLRCHGLGFFFLSPNVLFWAPAARVLPSPPLWIWSAAPKFFSKTFTFSIIFNSTWQISGEANVEKHADPRKKNLNSRKSRENCRNLLKAFLTSRKEENLYRHCDMNNAQRILSKRLYTLKGLLDLLEKASFSKEFWSKFHSGGGGSKNQRLWAARRSFTSFERKYHLHARKSTCHGKWTMGLGWCRLGWRHRTRRSHTGFILMINGGPISWKSCRKDNVSLNFLQPARRPRKWYISTRDTRWFWIPAIYSPWHLWGMHASLWAKTLFAESFLDTSISVDILFMSLTKPEFLNWFHLAHTKWRLMHWRKVCLRQCFLLIAMSC